MSVKHSLLFISLAALALGGTASAQERDQTFRDRDRNNDGVLTQGEYGGHPGNFRALDTNGDGVLSYEEFVRRHGRSDDRSDGRSDGQTVGFADRFTMMDRNRDGMLTIREYTGRDVVFRQMDVNDDDLVSRAEFNNEDEVMADTLERRRFRTLDRNDDGRLSRGESRMSASEFNRADVRRNGYLSMAEYLAWTNRTAMFPGDFDTLDQNNDGVISWGEWRSEQRDRATFDRLDRNDDRVVSRAEFSNQAAGSVTGSFDTLDRNDDGVISWGEWRSEQRDRATFERLDRNDDRVVSRAEFNNQAAGYPGTGDVMAEFRSRDRNNDGVLSRWESGLDREAFERADDDNDDVLTLKEYRLVSARSEVGDQFDVLDRNNDGEISRWEWNGDREDFDRMDRNDDGVLSRSEYGRRSGGGFLGSILGRVEDVRFNELDTNGDGILRPNEWRGSMGEFDRLDINNDGLLTVHEFNR